VGAGSWAVVQDDGTTGRSFSAKADGSYGYRVRACAGTGTANCSAYSATGTIAVAATTIATPAVPALTLPATSNTGDYTASWSTVANATHYELSEQVDGGAWAVTDDTSATSRNFSDKVDGSYGYRVRACNGDGTGHCSAYSSTGTVVVTIPLQVPAVPTLNAPGTSSTGIYAVSWSGSSIATHFELGEQVGGGAWAVIQDTSATSKAISGKTDGSYGYRVRACNGAGTTYCSAYSSVATVAVAIPPPPPAVPTLTLVSSVPVPDTRPPLFDIELQWSTSAGATYYDLQQSSFIAYTGTDTVYTGTVPGSADFHVRACNTGGCSAWSNAASSPPTPAVPTLTVPGTSSTGS
jgi:predicted phage tail protein